ncbi:MAG TPA: LamG domain-containing protein, partial [Opitutales bacterium]|nr:LamG domain-containing protein [Opitutales bacterium]
AWFGGGSDGATNEQLQVEGIGPKMPLGKWTHVAFVRNGHFVRLYLNGELAGEGGGFTLPFQDTATYEFGGFNAGGSTGGFTGRFCEIGLWQQAFTAEEVVQAMYARPAGTERMLLGYWPMDDGEGDSLRNIKVGGVSAQPVETTGNFDWVPCGNIPALDGTMVFPPPPGTLILAK